VNELGSQLPLRKRGTMEIFDVSVKLYKRYFVPIILWAAISGLAGLAGALIPGAGLISLFLTPIVIGSVGCCVAAAVHGHDVTIKDCWEFSKRRYGGILSAYITSSFLGLLIYGLYVMFAALLVYGGSAVFTSILPSTALMVLGIILIAALVTVGSIILSCVYAWARTAPLALCLEGNGADNGRFLRRTYDLMRGQWWRIFALVSLIGLAAVALFLIIGGVASMVQGWDHVRDILRGQIDENSITQLIFGSSMVLSLISILLTPLLYLSLAVQYLDLRVRKEALDLEWATRESAATQTAGQ